MNPYIIQTSLLIRVYHPLLLLFLFVIISVPPLLVGQENQQQINTFVDSRYKFDRFLSLQSTQEEIDSLCGKYLDSLENLRNSLPSQSSYLGSCITAEIERVAAVQRDYLTNRSAFSRVQLDYFWMKNLTHKEAVADFRTVLGVTPLKVEPTDRPDIRGDFGKNATILGLPWLINLDDFRDHFRQYIKSQVGSKIVVGMPGFPKSSFYYITFDGNFNNLIDFDPSAIDGPMTSSNESNEPGTNIPESSAPETNRSTTISPQFKRSNLVSGQSHIYLGNVGIFNRMNVVVDAKDQVVAVQFTCENPNRSPSIQDSQEVGIFNFVQFRRKAIHTAATYKSERFPEFFRIVNVIKTQEGRLLEVNVLYIPTPTAELISYALSFPGW